MSTLENLAVAPLERSTSTIAFLGTAQVALAPGVSYSQRRLTHIAGDRLELNEAADAIAATMSGATTVACLQAMLMAKYEIPAEAAREGVLRTLTAMDAARFISTRQSFLLETADRYWSTLSDLYRALMFALPVRGKRYPSTRYSPTLRGILQGVGRAHLATLSAGLLVLTLIALVDLIHSRATGVPVANRQTMAVYGAVAFYFALIPASAAIHEFAHWLACRAMGIKIRCVFARMFIVGVTHETIASRRGNSWVALAGPFGALAALVLVGWIAFRAELTPGAVIGILSAVFLVGIQHVASLTPLTAEGREVWQGFIPRRAVGAPQESDHRNG